MAPKIDVESIATAIGHAVGEQMRQMDEDQLRQFVVYQLGTLSGALVALGIAHTNYRAQNNIVEADAVLKLVDELFQGFFRARERAPQLIREAAEKYGQ